MPGPVKIHPRILRAMMAPAIGHRSPEFRTVIRDLTKGLRYLFQTKARVAVMTASASAGMEAAVSNLVRPGEKIVVASNGRFGERFADIARRWVGDGTTVVSSADGTSVDLAGIERALQGGGVKAVALVLNESSTGVENPGEAVSELCKKYGVFFIADGVTAFGGLDAPVDKWGIDIAIVGSQKCLGAPPGLTFLAVSDEAYAELKSTSLYLDLRLLVDKWAEEETPFTPATHLFFATKEALDMLVEETLEKRLMRTRRLAQGFQSACRALALPLLPDISIASPTLTAVRYPEGMTDAQIREPLKRDHGFVLAGGQGGLKGKIFRVGHMGFAQPRELVALVATLEELLARAGQPVAPGSGAAAFLSAFR